MLLVPLRRGGDPECRVLAHAVGWQRRLFIGVERVSEERFPTRYLAKARERLNSRMLNSLFAERACRGPLRFRENSQGDICTGYDSTV